MAGDANSQMAPIFRLNCDVLVRIFDLNADMSDLDLAYGVLECARNSSQVCREWRTLLLATPLIWSKIINFNEISMMGAKPEWIAELLRRTGSAPLDIKADNGLGCADARDTTHCLFDILRENWFRVRSLVMRVLYPEWGLQNPLLWDWMYTPAPQLEMFDVDFGIDSLKASPPSAPMFGNHAPSLRSFRGDFSVWDVNAPWVPHLRCIDIDRPCNMYQTLAALQATTNLEELTIGRLAMIRGPTPPLPKVHLHRLARFYLSAHFVKCVKILDRLEIPPGCSLMYTPCQLSERQFDQHRMSPMIHALSKVARRYFKANTATTLELCFGAQSIHFFHRELHHRFMIWIKCDNGLRMPHHAMTAFLTDFALPQFTQVTSLLLRLPTKTMIEEVAAFLACFPAVTTLSTGSVEIREIMRIQDALEAQNGAPLLVFPLLKTINLPQDQFASYDATDETTTIHKFIAGRHEVGREIGVGNGGGRYTCFVYRSFASPVN